MFAAACFNFNLSYLVDWPFVPSIKFALVRHYLSAFQIMKLFKPLGSHPFTDLKATEELNLFVEKNKSNKLRPHQPSSNGPYQVWTTKSSDRNESLIWSTEILQLNALPQPSSSCPEWFSDGHLSKGSQMNQGNPDTDSNSCFRQDLKHFDRNLETYDPYGFGQLRTGVQQALMRSTDSGLYSDLDCQRPPRSESSGSARSSFCLPTWEGSASIGSNSSMSTGSSVNSGIAGWERSLSNDLTDSSQSDCDSQLKESSSIDTFSLSPPWQAEELSPTYYSLDFGGNRNSIWSSHYRSQEDNVSVDKSKKGDQAFNASHSGFEAVSSSMRALTVSRDNNNNDTKQCLNRAAKPLESSYVPAPGGSWSSSNFRKVF